MSSGLELGAWKDIALLVPFSWTDSLICILGVWFEQEIHLEKIWLELLVKEGYRSGLGSKDGYP